MQGSVFGLHRLVRIAYAVFSEKIYLRVVFGVHIGVFFGDLGISFGTIGSKFEVFVMALKKGPTNN